MVAASTLLGAAGEHYVMSVLLRHGFIAALAPVGVPNCDIVVTDDIGDRLCAVQVKTRIDKGSDGGWHMSKKHESISSPRLFYSFLDFGISLTSPPACFVVPSEVVADVIKRSHQAWLKAPGAKGQERNDTDFRRFLPDFERKGLMIGCGPGWLEPYREAWGILAART
ncbi:hypothetical protein ANOBCDAF_00411 [Pleomorphomonas sp. T1.2MG-36]|uniref:hypothetical protein n=1 Tax=Pleomorphomonas sp. T1.2MG-36 TaxID=3041167 RepID=UPI0024776DCC|nr:hypothetical protein [Pleomorphomonas sp. T1.2MG-36]CAI9400084.1 hypothetical protein ANOBCDAF_00411 [Pleomorphomonas sp. T1.2MG-36]